MEKDHSNERIYFNLGMLAMDDNDFENAETWFKKAVQVFNFLSFYPIKNLILT